MEITIESSWQKQLQCSIESSYFADLIQFVKLAYTNNPGKVFPPETDVFRAFNCCPFDQVKVVILGQDPYPTKGHAHGLCFSCDSSVNPLPKSLQNIYKEMESDLGISTPKNGDLNHWANQGVLLLNSILTVEEGKPLSHANKGWERFTDDVIQLINQKRTGVVFVLWGAPAQTKASKVDERKHFVLKAPHPSPLSAYRGFFGSKPFSRINEYLRENGEEEIDWVNF